VHYPIALVNDFNLPRRCAVARVKWRQRVVTRRVLSRRVDRSSLTCLALIPPGLSCYFAWHSGHLTLPLTFTLHVNHRAGTDGVTGAVALWPLGMSARVIVYPLASTLGACICVKTARVTPTFAKFFRQKGRSEVGSRRAASQNGSPFLRDRAASSGIDLASEDGNSSASKQAVIGPARGCYVPRGRKRRFQPTRFAAIKVAEFKFAE